MVLSHLPLISGGILLLTSNVYAACFDPSPAFPPPDLNHVNAADPILVSAFASLQHSLAKLAGEDAFNTTSFSIEVTASNCVLWSAHHTARELNASRPGADPVTRESFYRIASITKTFTTLAILKQAAAGNLSLDDPVNNYLPNLKGSIPWKDITLRTLASQLSGIPRDWSQGDLLGELEDPTSFGLPPPNNTNLPSCYGYNEQFTPCNTTDLYYALSRSKPLFAPNYKSTYSNANFELLGLVLANVTGLTYEDAINQLILEPLNMTSGATFDSPPDNVSVLPSGIQWYHDVDEGVHNPTGGLFMSTSAMSSFLRYVLSIFNSPSILSLEAGNWLQPHSFTASTKSFYGMPWEIFRTDKILHSSKRAVTFYTKGGGLPGYSTIIAVVPEYNLGISIFVAGNGDLLGKLGEEVSVKVINAVEAVVERQMRERYVGRYVAKEEGLNSSLRLGYDQSQGLFVDDWISNGTELVETFRKQYPNVIQPGARVQLIPTLLHVDEEKQRGEKWRMQIVPPRPKEGEEKVWDDFCITDVDTLMYDGRPLYETVFWAGDGGRVGEVELTAFRVRLGREEGEAGREDIFVQDL